MARVLLKRRLQKPTEKARAELVIYPPRCAASSPTTGFAPMHTIARRGFTLIELLIVVVIIGILAAIAIPKFANTKTKAYTAAMKSDLRNLVTAEEAYFADSSKYTSLTTTVVGGNGAQFKASTGVNTPTIVPGTGAWYATTSHTQIPGGFACGIGVNTTNPIVPSAGDGEPACQ